MSQIGDQLQRDREPVLLLYLADELSPADRAEVKRLLSEDPSLQQHLESLRALHAQVVGQLDDLEAATELNTSLEVSIKRAVREMRRHQLESAGREPAALEASTFRKVPRWAYSVAAAAAIIFIVLGLWGVGVIEFAPTMPGPIVDQGSGYPSQYEDLAYQPERLEDILFASFGGEEIDHPLELEESEDPAAITPTDASS
jgi:hypothetical protein